MPARDMAAYMRKRRARLKAEQGVPPRKPGWPKGARAAPPPSIPLDRPLTLRERLDDAEMEAIDRRGATPEWDNAQGRRRAAQPAPARAVVVAPPSTAPRSMLASGGTPPAGPMRSSPAEASAAWRAKTEWMLAALAARADEQERRIAALEAQAADRRMQAANVAQVFFSAMRVAFLGG